MQAELSVDLEDPLLDLRRMSDQTGGDGYGSGTGDAASNNAANTSLIKRWAAAACRLASELPRGVPSLGPL